METIIQSRQGIPQTCNPFIWDDVILANGHSDTSGFFIKVEGTAGTLSVKPLGGSSYITTTFLVGWNPELVQAIEAGSINNTAIGIKWGK
jgi:hypothetical protein